MNMNDNEGAIVLLSLRCVICLAVLSDGKSPVWAPCSR